MSVDMLSSLSTVPDMHQKPTGTQARRPKMNEIRKPTKASHEEALLVFDLIVADKTEPDR
jgi:hypothetical protein